MARQDVLKILYESLDDKSNVFTSKRVTSIRKADDGDGEIVEAADGTQFTCDLVAGADGVRSVVRSFITERQGAEPAENCRLIRGPPPRSYHLSSSSPFTFHFLANSCFVLFFPSTKTWKLRQLASLERPRLCLRSHPADSTQSTTAMFLLSSFLVSTVYCTGSSSRN